MKKVLIVGSLAALSILGLAGVGLWFYLDASGATGPSPEEAEKLTAEGKRFAQGRQEKHCIIESMARLDCEETDRACMGELDFFLRGCLSAAEKTPAFCSPVPPLDAAMNEEPEFVEWAQKICEDAGRGRDNWVCHDHLKNVAMHCSGPAR